VVRKNEASEATRNLTNKVEETRRALHAKAGLLESKARTQALVVYALAFNPLQKVKFVSNRLLMYYIMYTVAIFLP
jgi:ribosomal protein S15P/S13E